MPEISFKFDIRDLWVGVFWQYSKSVESLSRWLTIYICTGTGDGDDDESKRFRPHLEGLDPYSAVAATAAIHAGAASGETTVSA